MRTVTPTEEHAGRLHATLRRVGSGVARSTLLIAALALPMAACEQEGPLEEAGESLDEAIEEGGEAVSDVVDESEDVVDEVSDGIDGESAA